jgi:uncharacterized membrane protein YhiD involved in acid resistance
VLREDGYMRGAGSEASIWAAVAIGLIGGAGLPTSTGYVIAPTILSV